VTRYVRVSLQAQSASAEMSPKVASSQSRLQRTCLRGVRCCVCVPRDPRGVGLTPLLLARKLGTLGEPESGPTGSWYRSDAAAQPRARLGSRKAPSPTAESHCHADRAPRRIAYVLLLAASRQPSADVRSHRAAGVGPAGAVVGPSPWSWCSHGRAGLRRTRRLRRRRSGCWRTCDGTCAALRWRRWPRTRSVNAHWS
jgi:hypothetical protein